LKSYAGFVIQLHTMGGGGTVLSTIAKENDLELTISDDMEVS